MKVEQARWSADEGWAPAEPGSLPDASLVFVFAGGSALAAAAEESGPLAALRAAYPAAQLVGCSTSGEIYDVEVTDDSLVATAVSFEHTQLRTAEVAIDAVDGDSCAAGAALARGLEHEGLAHVFVLSDGLKVNGSELVRGLLSALPQGVQATGGLSGDGARFEKTAVISGGSFEGGRIVALGLYGDALQVGYGSLGGWDPFGPEREITRSEANVLYEIDGKSALELYKRYLGEHAEGLPATGLLFPLSLRLAGNDTPVVRTILAVDEEQGSITFAGDVPTGARAQLMKANFDRLVDGAAGAAKTCADSVPGAPPDLALLISCVGRKLVLKQRIEEEVESVREVLGEATALTGFYSYGEISPFTPNARCELHNQTMTITTLSERSA